ncbi:unnamed protein product [Coregonus sp. 'balchen']|nr:unnamed protein product [Coregonus sp. 'balchen']
MEELQRKLDKRYDSHQRYDSKLASSVSSRMLKYVYEDSQELDSPEEKYPHSFHSHNMPRHLEMEQLCGFQDMQDQGLYPHTGLMTQRINIYRGGANYGPPAHTDAPKLDPNIGLWKDKKSTPVICGSSGPLGGMEGQGDILSPLGQWTNSDDYSVSLLPRHLLPLMSRQDAASSCQHCGGSRCVPCSLCHGSKLSMLPTASMSLSVCCDARPTALMDWRGASPVPNNTNHWLCVCPLSLLPEVISL